MKHKIIEGLFTVSDFTKNKTWLIDKNKEEIEIDEGLDLDYDEFLKMKMDGTQTMFCVICEDNGKKKFIEAHFTNIKDIDYIKEALDKISLPLPKPKIGRNDPCHCGSGKKYKKCCLNQ